MGTAAGPWLSCGSLTAINATCRLAVPLSAGNSGKERPVITWAERVGNLRKALCREPTLDEMLTAAQVHQMTPDEIEAQRQSWVCGMTARCEHGELDFEQCPQCRGRRNTG